jgi:hypothetical protein
MCSSFASASNSLACSSSGSSDLTLSGDSNPVGFDGCVVGSESSSGLEEVGYGPQKRRNIASRGFSGELKFESWDSEREEEDSDH